MEHLKYGILDIFQNLSCTNDNFLTDFQVTKYASALMANIYLLELLWVKEYSKKMDIFISMIVHPFKKSKLWLLEKVLSADAPGALSSIKLLLEWVTDKLTFILTRN